MTAAPALQIIRGGRVLNPGDSQFVAADILVAADRIDAVLAPGTPVSENAQIVDAVGYLLHPGLINAHTHGHGSLSKGMGDRWTLELLLAASVWTYANRGLQERRISTTLAAAEMALKGCTACYDLNLELPGPTPEGVLEMAGAYDEVGIRAVLAPAVSDTSFFSAVPGLEEALPSALRAETARRIPSEGKGTLEALATTFRTWNYPRDRILPALAPTIPMHCSDRFLQGCATLADDFGLGVHSHVAESKIQAISAQQLYGRPIVHHLAALGLIGPRFTVAHGVWLLPEEMALLGAAGASVAHNPGSNMRIGSGIADVRGMRRAGVNIGIGTDGANCADHQNMYEAMRLASLVSKVQGPDTEDWLSTEEVWHMACLGGARTLGLEGQIGRIAPRYLADIVFLEANHVNWLPLNNAVNQLIHSEDGTAVHTVMVGGRIIVQARQLRTVDIARLAAQTEAARARLEALNHDNRALFDGLAAIVNQFCPALARRALPINRYATWHECCGRPSGFSADGPSQ